MQSIATVVFILHFHMFHCRSSVFGVCVRVPVPVAGVWASLLPLQLHAFYPVIPLSVSQFTEKVQCACIHIFLFCFGRPSSLDEFSPVFFIFSFVFSFSLG